MNAAAAKDDEYALVIAVFGLLMLDVTAFFALEQYFGRVWSAALVSLFDFFVAGCLVIVAAMRPGSGELTLALDARQVALQGFESDARLIQDQFSALSSDLRSIKTSMANFTKHPIDEAMSQLVVPLSAILIRTLGRKRSSEAAQSSDRVTAQQPFAIAVSAGLEAIRAAHELMHSNKTFGKIVLRWD